MFDAAALKAQRKRLRLTQGEVAKAIGVAPQTYANYEQGRRSPDFATLDKMARLFKLPITALLNSEDEIEDQTNAEPTGGTSLEEREPMGAPFLDIASRLAAAIDRQNEALERLARAQEADARARLEGAEAGKIDAKARLTTAGALEQLSRSQLLAQENLSRAMALVNSAIDSFPHESSLPDAEEGAVAK